MHMYLLCVHVMVCVWACVWRSDNNFQVLVLSLHHMGIADEFLVIRLISKYLSP